MIVTLRTWLMVQVMAETNCNWMLAMEAVSSTAIEHPEWNLDERRSMEEWDAEADRQKEGNK